MRAELLCRLLGAFDVPVSAQRRDDAPYLRDLLLPHLRKVIPSRPKPTNAAIERTLADVAARAVGANGGGRGPDSGLAELCAALLDPDLGALTPTDLARVDLRSLEATARSRLATQGGVRSGAPSQPPSGQFEVLRQALSRVELPQVARSGETAAPANPSPQRAPSDAEAGIPPVSLPVPEGAHPGAPGGTADPPSRESGEYDPPPVPPAGASAVDSEIGAATGAHRLVDLEELWRQAVWAGAVHTLRDAEGTLRATAEVLREAPSGDPAVKMEAALRQADALVDCATTLRDAVASARRRAEDLRPWRGLADDIRSLGIAELREHPDGRHPTYRGLVAAADTMTLLLASGALPKAVWIGEGEELSTRLIELASDNVARTEAVRAVEWVETLPAEEHELLASLGRCPLDIESLMGALSAERRRRAMLMAEVANVQQRVGEAAIERAVAAHGRPQAILLLGELCVAVDRRVAELKLREARLSGVLPTRLREEGLELAPRLPLVDRFIAALDAMPSILKYVDELDEIERVLEDWRRTRPPSAPVPTPFVQSVQLGHATSGAAIQDPVVAVVKSGSPGFPDLVPEMGQVALPVRITLRPAPQAQVLLRYSSPQLTRPVQAPWLDMLLEPAGAGEERVIEAIVRVPVPSIFDPERTDRVSRIELRLEVCTPDGTERVAANKAVHFDSLRTLKEVRGRINNPLARDRDQVSRELVIDHPIGVQAHYGSVRGHMSSHQQSFLVSAPRRFGKTKMREVLETDLAEAPDLRILAVKSSYDRPEAWSSVEEWLTAAFGGTAASRLGPLNEPTPVRGEAKLWAGARQRARAAGVRTIWVLFDEAQRLFAQDGPAFGDRLKDILEADLTAASNQLAAVRFGFFGLPPLSHRIGNNLRGALSAWKADNVRPSDLESILRSDLGDGILSSAAAREALAAQTANFFVLRELLDQACHYLYREGRAWLLRDDVERVARELLDERFDDVWKYLSDPLNEHEDWNHWRPSPAYPVALAMARAATGGHEGYRVVVEARRILQAWTGREVLPKRVDALIRDLVEQGLVEDGTYRFRTWILREVLQRRAFFSSVTDVPSDVATLARDLSVGEVTLPPVDTLVELGQGRQANLFKERDGVRVYRVEDVSTEEARANFLRNCEVYQRLRDGLGSERFAREFFPELLEWGFETGAHRRAVLVYTFVPGVSLRETSLSARATAWAGLCLAKALRCLEDLGVMHRDIKPGNVVFESGGTAGGRLVLLDFGLSRVVRESESLTNTPGGSMGYVPPEVLVGGPKAWTFEGDLYALGRTLLAASKEPLQPTLGALLSDLTAEDRARRGSSRSALERFQAICEELKVFDDRAHHGESFDQLAQRLPARFRDVASKYKDNFVGTKMGILVDPARRLLDTAHFLNDLFEAWGEVRLGYRRTEGNSLNAVNHMVELDPTFRKFDSREARIVGRLRRAAAHAAWKKELEATTSRARDDGTTVEAAIRWVAQRLDEQLQCDVIVSLATALQGAGA